MHPKPTHIACACMGPVYGEPFCPCDMDRRGLPPSAEHVKANERAKIELARLFDVGGALAPSPAVQAGTAQGGEP